MTFYGPWITPDPVAVTLGTGDAANSPKVDVTGTDYATLCESTREIPPDPSSSPARYYAQPDGTYYLAQAQVAIYAAGDTWPDDPDAFFDLPPGAVDVEAEGGEFTSTLVAASVALHVEDNSPTDSTFAPWGVDVFAAADFPANLTYDYGTSLARPNPRFIPGADIVALDTAAMPTTVGYVDLTAELPLAAFTDVLIQTGGTMPYQVAQLMVGLTQQVTHDAPPTPALPVEWGGRFWKIRDVTTTLTWQQSRFRYLYAAPPPLRQRQRNDGLGRSAPRARQKTSRQASLRQRGYL